MLRFLSKLARQFQTANTRRTPRRASRRALLQLEGLEDRLVLSTASLTGSTPKWNDDGPSEDITFVYGTLGIVYQSQQITLSDKSSPSTPKQTSQGAGAGRAKFNEFEITKTTDVSSPAFFKNTPTKNTPTQFSELHVTKTSDSASPPR
jgi:hypothetical protein